MRGLVCDCFFSSIFCLGHFSVYTLWVQFHLLFLRSSFIMTSRWPFYLIWLFEAFVFTVYPYILLYLFPRARQQDRTEEDLLCIIFLYSCIPVFLYSCIPVFLYSCISVFLYSCYLYSCIPVFPYSCIPVFLYSCIPVFLYSCICRRTCLYALYEISKK